MLSILKNTAKDQFLEEVVNIENGLGQPRKPPSGVMPLDENLLQPSNWIAVRLLVVQVLLTVLLSIGIMFAFRAHLALVIVLCMGLGYMLARGLELAHGVMHGAFFRSAPHAVNRLVGNLLTFPFLLPWSQWRWTHFHHHRDPRIEGFDYPDVRTLTDLPKVLIHHVMIPHWSNSIRRTFFAWCWPDGLRRELASMVHDTARPGQKLTSNVRQEYIIQSVVLVGIYTGSAMIAPNILLVLLLAQIFGSVFHVMIELPEHVLADLDDPEPMKNSYEIYGSKLADWLCFNNTRHATHHNYPAVPVYHLQKVSDELEHIHKAKNYRVFWGQFLRKKILSDSRLKDAEDA